MLHHSTEMGMPGVERLGVPGEAGPVRHLCYNPNMPATQPRISVVVDRPLYGDLRRRAARDGLSLSQEARKLLAVAAEFTEDAELEELVARRRKSSRKAYSLAEVKRHFKIR